MFITAKGVITLKHIIGFKNDLVDYTDVKTYEMLCKGYESYQAYVDSEPLKKIIGNISIKNGFRINYIHYLEKAFDARERSLIYLEKYFIGESAYVDIIFSMIMGITREKSDCMIRMVDESCSYEEYADLCEKIFKDGQKYKLANILGRCVNKDLLEKDIDCDEWLNQRNSAIEDMSREQKEKYNRIRELESAGEKVEHMINDAESYLAEMFTSKLIEHEYTNPLEWYSKEEIESFIRENIREASSEYEENIERQLLKVNEMEPALVAKYFEFPIEWEENGLAELVRELYKVSKRQED